MSHGLPLRQRRNRAIVAHLTRPGTTFGPSPTLTELFVPRNIPEIFRPVPPARALEVITQSQLGLLFLPQENPFSLENLRRQRGLGLL